MTQQYTTLSPGDRRHIAFQNATLIGLIAVALDRAQQGKPIPPANLIEMMGEAAAIEPDDLPEDATGAALDFCEFKLWQPGEMAPNRFHEEAPPVRPGWMPVAQQFTEDDDALTDDDVDGDVDDDEDSDTTIEQ